MSQAAAFVQDIRVSSSCSFDHKASLLEIWILFIRCSISHSICYMW